jgi:hypothetical protein
MELRFDKKNIILNLATLLLVFVLSIGMFYQTSNSLFVKKYSNDYNEGKIEILSAGNVETYWNIQPVVDKYTEALYHFDENTGSTAFDATTNNNDGTITGADWVQGFFGSSLNFSSSENNNRVAIGHNAALA